MCVCILFINLRSPAVVRANDMNNAPIIVKYILLLY